MITPVELAIHDTQPDCWVGFQGKVYDITFWLPVHPGSAAAIAPYCCTSTEFESAFLNQHGTRKITRLEEVGTLKGNLV